MYRKRIALIFIECLIVKELIDYLLDFKKGVSYHTIVGKGGITLAKVYKISVVFNSLPLIRHRTLWVSFWRRSCSSQGSLIYLTHAQNYSWHQFPKVRNFSLLRSMELLYILTLPFFLVFGNLRKGFPQKLCYWFFVFPL